MKASNGQALTTEKHEHLIQSLALENHASIDEVRALFETEHAKLSATARVKTYIAVIATRLVRRSLHARIQSPH